jgi:hypothetical protein
MGGEPAVSFPAPERQHESDPSVVGHSCQLLVILLVCIPLFRYRGDC